MALQVSFYTYDGPADAMNKLKGLTPTVKDAVLYDSFDPQNPVIVLDELIPGNLIRYVFNKKIYVAQIVNTVAADHLFVYTGEIDSLTTCWQNGLIRDSRQIYAYSPSGNSEVMIDPRAPRATIAYRDSGVIGNFNQDFIIMTVLDIYPDNQSPMMTNRCTTTYGFDASNWSSLSIQFMALSAEDQQRFGNSIISVHLTDRRLVMAPDNSNGRVVPGITLTAASTSWFDFGTGSIATRQLDAPTGGTIYKLRSTPTLAHVANLSPAIQITPDTVDALITVYIQDIGAMTFSPADIGFQSVQISEIGANISIDPAGETIGAVLRLNGGIYNNIFVRSALPRLVPYFTDTSITNYTSLAASALTLVGGVIATASGIGSGIGVGAIAGGVAGIAGGITSSRQGSTSVRGGVSGAADSAEKRPSFWCIQEREYIDLYSFQQRFGKPDGQRFAIGPLEQAGYYQTSGAHLNAGFLPLNIVRAAEAQMDAGVWLL